MKYVKWAIVIMFAFLIIWCVYLGNRIEALEKAQIYNAKMYGYFGMGDKVRVDYFFDEPHLSEVYSSSKIDAINDRIQLLSDALGYEFTYIPGTESVIKYIKKAAKQ